MAMQAMMLEQRQHSDAQMLEQQVQMREQQQRNEDQQLALMSTVATLTKRVEAQSGGDVLTAESAEDWILVEQMAVEFAPPSVFWVNPDGTPESSAQIALRSRYWGYFTKHFDRTTRSPKTFHG